jgi:hypothetical protein
MYPAQDAEDICPVTINFGDYFMSGSIWRKFNSKFPVVPFDVFLSRKIENTRRKTLTRKMSSHMCTIVFVMKLPLDVKSKDLNHLQLCLLAKTQLRPRSPLLHLRLKLLISLKKKSMSICISALANLFAM